MRRRLVQCADRVSRTTLAALTVAVAAGAAAHAGGIDKSQSFYLASGLGKSVDPDFKGGTLRIDTTGTTYPQDFAVENIVGNTIDSYGHTATFSGVFSGLGSLTIADSVGGGAVTLSGISTYTGATVVSSGGTLAISGTGSIATSTGVQADGTFDISGTTAGASIISLSGANTGKVVLGSQSLTITDGAGTFAGTISGAGTLVVAGGATYLTGDNTYTGGTTITAGTLYVGSGATSGTLIGNILDNGTFGFDRTDTITFSNTVSGTGALAQIGSGTVIITTAQTYTGGTSITASTGTLALTGAGSIASSSLITITGTLDVSAAANPVSLKSLAGGGNLILGSNTLSLTAGVTSTFSGVISGTGGLVVTGGTQLLAGANTYTGGTTVTAGVLELGGGGTTGSIVGGIADSGTVAFNYSAGTVDTVITGTGGVAQVGTGITTLTAAQGYTGTTTISSGTLALAENADIASSSGVVDNGTLDISAMTSAVSIATLSGNGKVTLGSQTLDVTDGTGTFSGGLTGAGNLEISGGGESFSGSSSFTGTTAIASGATLYLTGTGSIANTSRVTVDGTLDISSSNGSESVASLAGGGTVSLGAKSLVLSNAADTFTGSITGSGGITVGAGTQTFSGNNTYLGTTVIYSTLKLVGTGSIASSSSIQGFGTFDISGTTAGAQVMSLAGSGATLLGAQTLTITGASGTYSGGISGTGGVNLTAGTQIFGGINTYTGGTTIASSATLQLGVGSNRGSLTGDVVDNGTLAFNEPSMTFSGNISGTGAVSQLAGTTLLFGTNTNTGGTTIASGGTLQLGNGGTTGSIQGNVADSGTLAFDRSDAVSYGGSISGTGGLTQLGTGTLTITGTNTYTGQTTVAAGTLVLTGNGSLTDSSQIVDNGTLDVSGMASNVALKSLSGTGSLLIGGQTLTVTAGSGDFTGPITGTGGVTMTGGTQALGGDNAYSGLTQVNGGTLRIDGNSTSSSGFKVASGATLGGIGTVSSVTVANGGTLSAGDAGVGTLRVNGTLQLGSSSITNVNVSSSGASEVIVSGATTLGGTLTVTQTAGFAVGEKWTVLTSAGGVNGNITLASTTSGTGNFKYVLSQDANDVYLQINLANLSSLLPAAATVNQHAVTAGVDAAISSGATVPAAIEQLGNLSGTTLTSTLDELSGEIGAGVAQAGEQAQDPFIATMFDRMDDGGRTAAGGDRMWISAFGDTSKIIGDADIGSHTLSQGGWGLAAGAEWDMNKALTLGTAVSYGRSSVHLADNLGIGAVNAYQLGGYALMRWSPHLYGSLAVVLGADRLNTHRVASTDVLDASATALSFGLRYETGIHFNWGTPFAAIHGDWFNAPDYNEVVVSGPGSFALHYDAHTNNRIGTELGLREIGHVNVGDGVWRVSGQLAWAHDFTNTTDAFAAFQSVADSGFVVRGARQAPDSGLLSLGTGYTTNDGIDFNLAFDSAVSRNSQSYGGNATIGVKW